MSTYYVRSSGGSDGNTGLSFAQGWATIQHAVTTASANTDVIIICDDGVHLPTAAITFSGYGSISAPITITGGNATGIIDGTIPVISGASLPANTSTFVCASVNHYRYNNLRFTLSTRFNIELESGCSNSSFSFVNCRFDNSSSSGVRLVESHSLFSAIFINCEIDNNTSYAVSTGTSSGFGTLVNCSIHDNGNSLGALSAHDSSISGRSNLIGCLIYNNAGSGVYTFSGSGGGLQSAIIKNNVFYNNGVSGIYISDFTYTGNIIIMNNIFRNNTEYGIFLPSNLLESFTFCDYNCASGNGSGAINVNSGILPGDNNILDDPLFISEASGSEDFRLQNGSPCINTGCGYNG